MRWSTHKIVVALWSLLLHSQQLIGPCFSFQWITNSLGGITKFIVSYSVLHSQSSAGVLTIALIWETYFPFLKREAYEVLPLNVPAPVSYGTFYFDIHRKESIMKRWTDFLACYSSRAILPLTLPILDLHRPTTSKLQLYNEHEDDFF